MDFDALYQQLMQGPDENAKRQAMAQALAAASFGILGARTGGGWRGALGAVGQGGLLGQQVYNNEMANAAQAPMQQLAKASALMDFQGKKQAFDDTNAAREVLKNFQMPSALPSMAPTVGNAAALAAQPKPGNYEKFNAIADALEAKGLIQQANVYRQAAEKYAPQYDGTETVMKDGKPVLLQKFKNQAPTEMGYQPKPDYKQVDTGGQVGFYDPLTGMIGGQFAKTMTPGEIASNNIAQGNLAVNQGQLGLARDRFGFDVAKDARDQGANKPLTESQAKATAFANQMAAATKQLDQLAASGFDGSRWGQQTDVAMAGSEGIPYIPGSAAAARALAGDKAQKMHQAQLQWTEAALRFMTGANAPKEEVIRNAATYFPQPGEGPDVVAQKRVARENMEQSIRLAAGRGAERAAPMGAPVGPPVGTVVAGFRFKGGDPNKRENWAQQ